MDDTQEVDRDEAPGAGAPAPNAVDLVKLVEKVRELMREDLRLERARGAAAGTGQRW
jgi:hypothetical protein